METDINKIQVLAESTTVEFKEQIPSKEKLISLICAFANTAGGDLYIGISDSIPREVIGIDAETAIESEEKIAALIIDNIYPNVIPLIQLLNVNGKYVLCIHVEAGFQRPYKIKKGKYKKQSYIRIGSSTRIADYATQERLKLISSGLSWDRLPCQQIGVDELDNNLIDEYLELRQSRRGIPMPIGNKMEWLSKMRFVLKMHGDYAPSMGGVLFFHTAPGEILPQVQLEMARFKGITSEVFLDKSSDNGPIWQQYTKAFDFFKKHIPFKGVRSADGRLDSFEYPELAFREFMINALCHRSFEDSTATVKFAIFDDIIEFTNPGSLPEGLEVSDIGTGISILRNPVIAKGLNEIGLIEGWGTGIHLAQQKLREHQLPEAKIILKGLFTQVSSKWKWTHDLSSTERKIIKFISGHDYVTSGQIATLCQFSDRTARKYLSSLIQKGYLKKIGTTKKSEYTLQQ